MKVLVLYEEIPESSTLMLIDMTVEEFNKLKAAHSHYSGCYSTSNYKDEISQALCRWNFAVQFVSYPDSALTDNDKEWMEDCDIDPTWFNRFEGRVHVLKDLHVSAKFDAFINTGMAM